MNYKVSFSGKWNCAEDVNYFVMNRTDNSIDIIINDETFRSMNISEMDGFIENCGLDFITKYGNNETNSNLSRAFQITNDILTYALKDVTPNTNAFIKHIVDTFTLRCYNKLAFGWSLSDDRTVEAIYFLDKEHNANQEIVSNLYDKGFLHRIVMNIEGNELTNYYVPCKIPNPQEIKMPDERALWVKIRQDIRKQVPPTAR